MISVKIDSEKNLATISAPFNEEFDDRIFHYFAESKVIGREDNRQYIINAKMIDAAREVMLDVFGEDDIHPTEHVNVRIHVFRDVQEENAPVMMYGKTLARYNKNMCKSYIDPGVCFVKGKPGYKPFCDANRGGYNYVEAGSTIMLYDVPRSKIPDDDPHLDPESPEYKHDYTAEIFQQRTSIEELRELRDKIINDLIDVNQALREEEEADGQQGEQNSI